MGCIRGLGCFLVGDDPSSHIYVNLKEKAAKEAGIETDIQRLPADVPDRELDGLIKDWNDDPSYDAILIQLPLPTGHGTDGLIATMDPKRTWTVFIRKIFLRSNKVRARFFLRCMRAF